MADLLVLGGKVFTAEAGDPWAQALAIEGDRIVAVGSDGEIGELYGPDTRVVQLDGHVVIPGINDAHRHFQPWSPDAHYLTLTPLEPSWEETRAAIEKAVAEVPPGTWIHGIVGVTIVTDPSVDRSFLDSLAPEHPVKLAAFYGHGDIYNSQALAQLAVEDDAADPVGGFFEREPGSQRVNGRVFEYAQWNLTRQQAADLEDRVVVEQMRAGAEEMLALGITSMQIMPIMPFWRYVELLQRAELPLRVRAIRFPGTSAKGRHVETDAVHVAGKGPSFSGGDRIQVLGVKWILDGTPLERGSAMREGYLDEPAWSGRLNFPPEEIAAMLGESLAADEPLLLHAVGDRTLEVLFDEMEKIEGVDWPERRLRIEHGDGLAPDLAARAARLGVIVVQNPTHFALPVIAEERIGRERHFQPLRSLIEAGIPLALGSDGPPNPWLDVMLAMIHPAAPEEAITIEQAISAYTLGAAYSELQEGEKGSLAEGKLADLAILSQDVFEVPPDAIPATRSLLTILGGNIVYDSGELDRESSASDR